MQNFSEDILQHYGKKGMKWGVRKRIQETGRNINRSLNERRAKKNAKLKERLNAYHDKRKGEKKYQSQYNQAIRRYKDKDKGHLRAVARVRQATTQNRVNNLALTAAILSPTLIGLGNMATSSARKFATNPENIRRGKNIILAMKRSKFRYADAAKFTRGVNF